MCCGRSLLSKSYMENRKLPPKISIEELGIGSNPGGKREAGGSSALNGGPKRHVGSIVAFVYTGRTGLTVVSPITGMRYRFEKTGARLEVDARDRSWMKFVPNLKAE